MGKAKPSIFLSHSHRDKKIARKLAHDLENQGIQVWLDEAEILVGESLITKISKAINKLDHVAVLLSKSSVKSEWVQKELELAINKEIEKRKIVVLPIVLEDCDLPLFLKGKRWVDLRSSEYSNGLEEIVDSVFKYQKQGKRSARRPQTPAKAAFVSSLEGLKSDVYDKLASKSWDVELDQKPLPIDNIGNGYFRFLKADPIDMQATSRLFQIYVNKIEFIEYRMLIRFIHSKEDICATFKLYNDDMWSSHLRQILNLSLIQENTSFSNTFQMWEQLASVIEETKPHMMVSRFVAGSCSDEIRRLCTLLTNDMDATNKEHQHEGVLVRILPLVVVDGNVYGLDKSRQTRAAKRIVFKSNAGRFLIIHRSDFRQFLEQVNLEMEQLKALLQHNRS